MEYQNILYAVDEGVLTITFNRPDRLNAMNPAMRGEFIAALDRADADDAVRAIVITGSGKGFCAGADVSRGVEGFVVGTAKTERGPYRGGGGRVSLRLFECNKPLIAAINGVAVGMGVAMTLPMDYRICSTEARIGFVYTQRGITLEAASSWFLPRIVGMPQALDWTLSGRIFGAEEALKGGLVRSVHAPDALLKEAQRIGREIAKNTAPVSVAVSRQLLWKMMTADHPMFAHQMESRLIPEMTQHPDAKEGVAAAKEKRTPNFTGRVSEDLPAHFPWWDEKRFF